MDWMYKNSTETIDREEYLLGKAIDKNFEQLSGSFNDVDKDITPASIFSNAGSNLQVDVVRKLKEDPLEQIRQKEIETRKQLLKNPVKLKKLQNMLKANQEKQEKILKKKAKKKKKLSEEEMIDQLLTSKFLKMKDKLGGKKLAELGQGGFDSSRDRGKDKGIDSRKKKKKKRSQNESGSSESSSDSSSSSEGGQESRSKKYSKQREISKRNLAKPDTDRRDSPRKPYGLEVRGRSDWRSTEQNVETPGSYSSRSSSAKLKAPVPPPPRKRLTEEEKAAKLKEMSSNAEWRSQLSKTNKRRYKEEQKNDKEDNKDFDEGFFRRQMALATSGSSVQDRIKSNVNNIQRSERHMSEKFACR